MNQERGLHTIPSLDVEVWRRLYARYLLEPYPASVGPDVSKTIVPVTQADELKLVHGVLSSDDTYTAQQAVNIAAHTVPEGRRWSLYGLDANAQLVGDNQMDQFIIGDASNGFAAIFLDDFTATARHQYWLPQAIKLEPGDLIQVHLTGAGVDPGTLRTQVWVSDEALF